MAVALMVAVSVMGGRLSSVADRSAGTSFWLGEWRSATRVIADHPPAGVRPEGYCISATTQPQGKQVLVTSRDGVNWSRTVLDALLPNPNSYVTRVQVTETAILVTVVDNSSKNSDGVGPTIVLVGTPNA